MKNGPQVSAMPKWGARLASEGEHPTGLTCEGGQLSQDCQGPKELLSLDFKNDCILIFKSFPGHQQKLHNASGAPCKLMACWARPPSIELMAHGHLLVSAPGFRGEKGGEEKSPQIITQPEQPAADLYADTDAFQMGIVSQFSHPNSPKGINKSSTPRPPASPANRQLHTEPGIAGHVSWLYERFGLPGILVQTLAYVHLPDPRTPAAPRPASCSHRRVRQPRSTPGLLGYFQFSVQNWQKLQKFSAAEDAALLEGATGGNTVGLLHISRDAMRLCYSFHIAPSTPANYRTASPGADNTRMRSLS
ncbi:hypothetical protein Anapl_03289 [Anas platyrhynchos]|uniref:Uncharacterized protein n=1 Tax=Anas platyrhynchos TaxID=8839 RepID=R0JRC7_ANAPL|nr:hypothetical protein Anapl_03289 [Anas platyrhynchos]